MLKVGIVEWTVGKEMHIKALYGAVAIHMSAKKKFMIFLKKSHYKM